MSDAKDDLLRSARQLGMVEAGRRIDAFLCDREGTKSGPARSPQVHDILLHDINPRPPYPTQRLYRVTEVALGGEREEGYTILEVIGMADGGRETAIPHLMLDDMVARGVVTVIWSAPRLR